MKIRQSPGLWLIFLIVGTLLYYILGRNAPYFQLMAQGLTREDSVAEAKTRGQEMFPSGKIKESLLTSARTWKTWPLVELGMRRMVDHLIEVHGYRRLAYLSGPAGEQTAEALYRGYQQALAAHDIPFVAG